MSMSATISLSNATPTVNQPFTAYVTISNSGAAAVTITSLTPYCTPPGSATLSQPSINPNANPSVPASGTLVINYQAVLNAPGTFAMGASIDSSDGSIFSPSTTNAVVSTYVPGTQPAGPIQNIAVLTGDVTTGPISSTGSSVATVANVPAAALASATVTAKLLTGFVSGAGVVAAADTILAGIDKLDGNQIASAAIATSVQGGLFGSTGANVETLTADGSAISVTKFLTNISAAGAQTRTLAVPTAIGQMKIIYMTVHGGDCTLALTNVDAGTTAIFTAVGSSLVLMSVSTSKWTKIGGSATIT